MHIYLIQKVEEFFPTATIIPSYE